MLSLGQISSSCVLQSCVLGLRRSLAGFQICFASLSRYIFGKQDGVWRYPSLVPVEAFRWRIGICNDPLAPDSLKHLLSHFQQRGACAHTLLGFGHHHFAQIRPESNIVKARESNDLPASQRDQGESAGGLESLGDGCVPPGLLPDAGGGLKQALDFLRISHFRGAYQQSYMFLTHANSLAPRPGSADSVQRRLETPFPCTTPSTQPPCQQADSSGTWVPDHGFHELARMSILALLFLIRVDPCHPWLENIEPRMTQITGMEKRSAGPQGGTGNLPDRLTIDGC